MTKERESSDFERMKKELRAGKIIALKEGPNGEIRLEEIYTDDAGIVIDNCDEDSWMKNTVFVKGEYKPVFPANA